MGGVLDKAQSICLIFIYRYWNYFTCLNSSVMKIIKTIFLFYFEGFHGMTTGKKLWLIIGIKLFVMFAILKFFFFPNFLKTNFKTDKERGDYVLEQLTK